MSNNRFTRRQVFSDFQPLAMEELLMPLQAAQSRHNNMLAAGDELSASLADTQQLPVHNDLVKQEVDNLSKGIDEISDKLVTDGYSPEMFRQLRNLKRERDAAFSSTGKIGRARQAYEGFVANRDAILKNKDMDPKDQQAAIDYAYNRYAQNQGLNSQGLPADYNAYYGMDTVKIQDKANDLMQMIKPQEIERSLKRYQDEQGNWIISKEKIEELTAKEIASRVLPALQRDREVQQYLQFQVETGQIREEDIPQILEEIALSSGVIGDVNNRSYIEDLRVGKGNKGSNSNSNDGLLVPVLGAETILEGNYSDKLEAIEDLKATGEPGSLAKARFLEEKLNKVTKDFESPNNKMGHTLKNELDKYKNPIEEALSEIQDVFNLEENTPEAALEALHNAYRVGQSEDMKNAADRILENNPKLKKALEATGEKRKIRQAIVLEDLFYEAKENYNDALSDWHNEHAATISDEEVGIAPSAGNMKDIQENLNRALLSGGATDLFSIYGMEDDDSREKLEELAQNPDRVEASMLIKAGDLGLPKLRVRYKTGDGSDAKIENIDLELNHSAKASAQGKSFVETFANTLTGARDSETGKYSRTKEGEEQARDIVNSVKYRDMVATNDRELDQSEELSRFPQFGERGMRSIKKSLNIGSEGKLNVYKNPNGQGVTIMLGKKGEPLNALTVGKLREMFNENVLLRMNILPDAKDSETIDFPSQATAFAFLDNIQ